MSQNRVEAALSIQAALHDIDRWAMNALIKDKISDDRRGDIKHQAKRIAELADEL